MVPQWMAIITLNIWKLEDRLPQMNETMIFNLNPIVFQQGLYLNEVLLMRVYKQFKSLEISLTWTNISPCIKSPDWLLVHPSFKLLTWHNMKSRRRVNKIITHYTAVTKSMRSLWMESNQSYFPEITTNSFSESGHLFIIERVTFGRSSQ